MMMVVGDENSMDSANLGWEFIYFLKNNSYPFVHAEGVSVCS